MDRSAGANTRPDAPRTCARVIERNRGLYFAFRLFVPGIGACVGVSGGVGGLISPKPPSSGSYEG